MELEGVGMKTKKAKEVMEVSPGIYKLREDVPNPKRDKRFRVGWLGCDIWKSGDRFRVKDRYGKLILGQGYDTLPLDDVRVQALLGSGVLERDLSLGGQVDWLIEEEHAGLIVERRMLMRLVEMGKVTLEDLRHALKRVEE